MEFKANTETIFQYFKNHESFTTNDVSQFFSKSQTNIKKATVNWRIYELVQKGLLQRIGRGVLKLGKENCFTPAIYKKQKTITSFINKQFPLAAFCTWHTSALKEFFQHVVARDFLLVEVEKEAIGSVYNAIKETNKNTFKEPSHEIMETFVFERIEPVIIKTLISESPLQKTDSIVVPTLEKILVDLYADNNIFFFLQGKEYFNIFENAVTKYTINTDRLLRYAKRRNKKEELQKMLVQTNGKKTGLVPII
jgi:hypothetical protein